MKRIAQREFTTPCGIKVTVKLLRKKYQKGHIYKILHEGEVFALGNCPRVYTTHDIYKQNESTLVAMLKRAAS